MLTKQQRAVRTALVAALRSGKYQQRHDMNMTEGKMCAVQVLWQSRITPPSASAITALGITHDDVCQIFNMNDGTNGFERHTFDEIADTIELLTLADSDA